MADAREQEEQAARETRLRQAGWPMPLIKATYDAWQYLVILRSGRAVSFERAIPELDLDWVYLAGDDLRLWPTIDELDHYVELHRGIAVRISEIVAVADCGH